MLPRAARPSGGAAPASPKAARLGKTPSDALPCGAVSNHRSKLTAVLRPPLAALALAALASVAAAQDAPAELHQAEALLRAERAAEAYQLLQPLERRLAGDPDYDYLLGSAALAAGEPSLATVALERAVATDPRHGAARIDLGRAYRALGDEAQARAHFEAALALDPPQPLRQAIVSQLDAPAHGTPAAPALTGYIEGGLGLDSNVNAGASRGTVFLPLFGTEFALGNASQPRADRYAALAAGGELAQPLDGGLALFAAADLRARSHAEADAFDQRSGELRAGLRHRGERHEWRFALGHGSHYLEEARYRDHASLAVEGRYDWSARDQLNAFAQSHRLRYVTESLTSQNADQTLLGVGWLHALGAAVVFGSAYAGDDTATDARADGDRGILGLRFGVQMPLAGWGEAYAAVSLQRHRYGRANPLFQAHRRDDQYDLTLGFARPVDGGWTLRPQATYTRADSNFSIYDYRRLDLSVVLRREFR